MNISADQRGTGVRLRDVTLDDADLLDAWNADPTSSGEFNDFGGTPKPTDREALARGPLRNERNGQLIVERIADGQPMGSRSASSAGMRWVMAPTPSREPGTSGSD